MRVTVLMGGTTGERDVSLASGSEVARALREAGHEVVAVDTLRGPISEPDETAILEAGIGAAPPSSEELKRSAEAGRIAFLEWDEVTGSDIVFPTLHGGAGEDGTVQAALELAGLTFCGSDRLGCSLAMDKDVGKRLLRDAGVATPDWVFSPRRDDARRVAHRLGLPLIAKPAAGGSSVALELVETAERLGEVLARRLDGGDRWMCEGYVRGREFTVAVLGGDPLPVGEIVPASEHRLFDYQAKYQEGGAAEIFPADLEERTAVELQRVARLVHDLFRLRHFSRVDFMVDEAGESWVLEANALPGLTSASLFPKAAAAAGIDFPELCDRIVRLATGTAGGVERVERRHS